DTPPQRRTLGDAAVLVPPGDPAALAAALIGLADDRAELARMRRVARQLAGRRFTPEQIVAPLVERLRAATGTRPAAPPSPEAQPLRQGRQAVGMASPPPAPGLLSGIDAAAPHAPH